MYAKMGNIEFRKRKKKKRLNDDNVLRLIIEFLDNDTACGILRTFIFTEY